MSLRLGPIHHTLYFKIQFLMEMDAFIARFLEEEHTLAIDQKPLEEIVDATNIHKSLQEMIQLVEASHGMYMSQLYDVRRNDWEEAIVAFGNQHIIFETLDTIPNTFQTYFLNGMPCDRNVEIIEESDVVEIYLREDEHKKYYTNPNILSMERTLLFGSMLGTGLKCSEQDNKFLFERS